MPNASSPKATATSCARHRAASRICARRADWPAEPDLFGRSRPVEKVLASVKVGAGKLELRDFPMPQIDEESALLKMEVAGICGTDVKMFKQPLSGGPVIMGHENIGYIAKAGRKFSERKGVKEGDLVFVEHYVPDFHCEWC